MDFYGAKAFFDAGSSAVGGKFSISPVAKVYLDFIGAYYTKASKVASEGHSVVQQAIYKSGGCREPKQQGPGGDRPDDNYSVSDLLVFTGNATQNFYRLAAVKNKEIPLIYKGFGDGLAGSDCAEVLVQRWDAQTIYFMIEVLDYIVANMNPLELPRDMSWESFKKLSLWLRGLWEEFETTPDVAILANGFALHAAAFLESLGEPSVFKNTDTPLDELSAYPILVVPSGGLSGMDSPQFKLKLEQYVKSGGTLVVFPQEWGKDYSNLPGSVSGHGWAEDISCQFGSAFVDTYHPVLSGLYKIESDINVDGYFTGYPEDSLVLLRRTANFYPAMVMYQIGQGRVIATTAYPDYAYSLGAATEDEEALMRDIIAWARNPQELKSYRAGDKIVMPVKVTNNSASAIAKVSLSITDSTYVVRQKLDLSTSLQPGEARYFNLEYEVPREKLSGIVLFDEGTSPPVSLGIWHVDYSLYDASNTIKQTQFDAGRFAVSEFEVSEGGFSLAGSRLGFKITSERDTYLLGSNVTFTAHVYNGGTENRTLRYSMGGSENGGFTSFQDPTIDATVSVPAGSEATITANITVNRRGKNAIGFIFYDDTTFYLVGYAGMDYTVSPYILFGTTGSAYSASQESLEITPPSDLSFRIGENATMTFTVRNGGSEQQEIVFCLFVPGMFDGNEYVTLAAGEEKVISFTFSVPEDLEEKNYKAFYGIGEPTSELTLFIKGARILVDASLDKILYKENEKAQFTLEITNNSEFGLDLYAKVRLNEYEEMKRFKLPAWVSGILKFEVPVTFTGQKLYYGIHFDSGRSLYINSMFVYEDKFDTEGIRLYTDKQVYQSGEEMTVFVQVKETNELTVIACRQVIKQEVSGNATFTIPLSQDLGSGTYVIYYRFGDFSSVYPVDVVGYSAVIPEFALDKSKYVSGETINAVANVVSSRDLQGLLKLKIYDKQRNLISESGLIENFVPGENRIAVSKKLITPESGIHSFVLEICIDVTSPFFLVSVEEFFEVQTNSSVSGQVVDKNGAPVAGASVWVSGPFYGDGITGEDGRYSVSSLIAGSYSILVTPPPELNLLAASREVTVGDNVTLVANFTLTSGGAIEGLVKDPGGNPVANAFVMATGPAWGEDTTDEQGHYFIGSLGGGSYEVVAVPPWEADLMETAATANVTPGETTHLDFVLSTGGAIEGVVRDSEGNPISDATVSATGPTLGEALTDEQGHYFIGGLVTGSYEVMATPPWTEENLMGAVATANVTVGQTASLDLILSTGGAIEGVVRDIQGNPVAYAVILASGPSWGEALTDEQGHYFIGGLVTGSHEVTAIPPWTEENLMGAKATANVTIGQTASLDLILSTGGVVQGYARDSGGNPIADVFVSVSGPSWGEALTDEQGHYFISGLDTGSYQVAASPPWGANLTDTTATAAVVFGQTTSLDLVLQSGGAIEGFVRDSQGNPIGHAVVSASGPSWGQASADEQGHYFIGGLDAGSYELVASPPWGAVNLREVTETAAVVVGSTTMLDFTLSTGGAITGLVRDTAGHLIAGAIVSAGGPSWGEVSTDAEGRYFIGGLDAGSYEVTVIPPWETHLGQATENASVVFGQTTNLDFALSTGGAIEGIVRDSQGNPLADVFVSVSGPSWGEAITDGLGHYFIGGLDSGGYEVMATPLWGANLLPTSENASVVFGQTTTLDFVLSTGGAIEGFVRDPEDNPVANAYVFASGPSWGEAVSDEGGYYLIDGLGGGSYNVTALPPWETNLLAATETVTVVLGQTTSLDFVLSTGGAIEGFVRDPEDNPVANAYVFASGASWGEALSDEGGYYFVDGLLTGSYNVTALPPWEVGLTGAWAIVDVVAGQAASLNFTLQRLISPEQLDLGDAPDPPFPTLLSHNGASHILDGKLFLGMKADPEPDGQPSSGGTADDTNGDDDEDGVVFTSPLVPGLPASVDVTANITTNVTGMLQAWVDFNRDGDWADTGEQVFTDRTLTKGLNRLSFPVPPQAVPGPTFARFRFSTIPDLSFNGAAPNGEVEDYMVAIGAGEGTLVFINAPGVVSPGGNFTATVEIRQVENFDACNYDVSFDPVVLRLDSVTAGNIGDVSIPVDFWSGNATAPGTFRIVQNIPDLSGASGSGCLAVLHFRVIGVAGESSNITLTRGTLSNTSAQDIPATWIGDVVHITPMIPGDANMDDRVNALDITKVERIIAHLDPPTPGADANLDTAIDILDVTKVERIIAGLD